MGINRDVIPKMDFFIALNFGWDKATSIVQKQ